MAEHALAETPPRTRFVSLHARPQPCTHTRRTVCAGTLERKPRPSPPRELRTTHARVCTAWQSRATPTNRQPHRGRIGAPSRLAPPGRLHPLGPARFRDSPNECHRPL